MKYFTKFFESFFVTIQVHRDKGTEAQRHQGRHAGLPLHADLYTF